jgi:hypothetical protein
MYPDPKSYRKRDPVLPPQKGDYGKLTEVMPQTPYTGLGMRGLEQYIDPPTVRRYMPHDGVMAPGTRRGGS